MEDSLIIKKIYINDYIINTKLLDKSLFKLLLRILSNKFYKTDKIEYKVNHILKKVDKIFHDYSGQKIFNLAYQPYNQKNIKSNYIDKKKFNKKWIIPIVNETKSLNQQNISVDGNTKYINNNTTLLNQNDDDDTITYNGDPFIIYNNDNIFESSPNLNKMFINILGSKNREEFEVLINENIYNPREHESKSSTNSKIIREPFEKTYYIQSDNKLERISSNEYEVQKSIKDTFNQVRNLLENEHLNIRRFLILNPIKLLTSNYNIFIGNTISYLGEILYHNNKIDTFINTNIDKMIDNLPNKLENKALFELLDESSLEYYTVDYNDFQNEYNNNNGFIWNYLNIAKNLEKIEDNQKIISIKILKHIYNLFGYDLNKIPFCYLNYLKDFLENNIISYVFDNYINYSKSVLDLFNKYKENKISEQDNPTIQSIKNLYNINDVSNSPLLYGILLNNTSDKGKLFYLNKYINEYLNKTSSFSENIVINKIDNTKSDKCKNYRLVKTYNSLQQYNEDTFKFVDAEYSQNNYLIEYNDLIGFLNNSKYRNINNIYNLNTILKLNDKNELNANKNNINQIEITEINEFILNNKLYLYNLLFNKSEFNYDILFNKLTCFKYKNRQYIQIPIQIIQNLNIIYITIENKFYNIIDNIPIIIDNNNDIEYINKQRIINCQEYNNIQIQQNNLNNQKKFYDSLNNLRNTHINKIEKLYSNLKNKNIFYNENIQRIEEIKETQFYFKNLPPIEYIINNYSNSNSIQYDKFIRNLSELNINFDNKNLKELKEIINENDKLSPSIENIKSIDQEIKKIDKKNLWSTIHRYINEYEIFHTHIIQNSNKYTRAYYKMKELMIDDDIIKKPNFRLISLAEAPGFFVNCIKDLVQKSDWNDYMIYTWLLDTDTTEQKQFWKSFNSHIWGANENGPINKDEITGDLTNVEQIKKIIEHVGEEKADLITADGGMEKKINEDYILEEFNHFPLFLGEIITALFTQKIAGTFILKMYDISYINTINLIHLLNHFYNSVKIIKPYTSRPCNSEKYIKCEDFRGIPESLTQKIKENLFKILNNCKKNKEKPNQYKHIDIFKNFDLDNTNILKFNENIIITTRELYTKQILAILQKNDKEEMNLITTYFKDTTNITSMLENNKDEKKGYFLTKIENCIRLAQYLKLTNDLKPQYINYYKNNYNLYDEDNNIYPPHFNIKYKIDKEEESEQKISKISKFVDDYCILFTKFGENHILDEKIRRTILLFINNSNIKNINNVLIQDIKLNINNLPQLYKILIDLCKKQNISTTFNLYKTNIINIIIKFQNNIRHLIGWFLCKYTYIPMYPKYKIYDNVEDQIDICGIKINSHQYICCYSGDKLDKEDYDEFMGVGENIHRSINLDESNEINETNTIKNDVSNTQLLQKIDTGNLTVEEKICKFILGDIFNLNKEDILNGLNKCSNIPDFDTIELNNLFEEYDNYYNILSKKYDFLDKIIYKKPFIKESHNNYSEYNYINNDKKYWKPNKKGDGYIKKFHITSNDIQNNNISLFSKEEFEDIVTAILNDNTDIKTPFENSKFIRQHLFSIYFSKFIYSKYIKIILYSLIYVQQITEKNPDYIIKKYLLNSKSLTGEEKLFNNIIKNTTEFDAFKNELLNSFTANLFPPELDFQNKINLETNVDDIINLVLQEPGEIIKKFITFDENNKYNWLNENNIEKLNNSKTVLTFLNNCSKINNALYIKFLNVLNSTEIIFKYEFKHYIPINLAKNLFNKMNDIIQGNVSLSVNNNIINNIIHNRPKFDNQLLLNYEKTKNILFPYYNNYNYDDTKLDYSFNSYIYYFKYLFLNVYEKENPFYGKHREFKNIDDIYLCIYTQKTKNIIIKEIEQLSFEELQQKYISLLEYKNKILNKYEFINKNLLNFDNKFSSIINNVCYSISLDNINILYQSISKFYKKLDSKIISDEEKNIIMRFYNDPVDNIIKFLNIHKDTFYNSTTKNIQNIIDSLDLTFKNDINIKALYDNIINLNDKNINEINIKIIKLNNKLIEQLKKYDISETITKLTSEDLTVKNIMDIINNIKQKISYINNFSNEQQQMNTKNIELDIKNKYKFVKNKYISDINEYNSLINLVRKFYNFDIQEDYDLINLRVIFNKLSSFIHFYPNNIVFLNNNNIYKNILLNKIYIIFINSFTLLNENITTNPDELINKKYLHTNNNDKTYTLTKLENLQYPISLKPSDDQIELFKTIINNTVISISKFSDIISTLEPNSINNDDGIENDDNYDGVGSFDEISGSVEDE